MANEVTPVTYDVQTELAALVAGNGYTTVQDEGVDLPARSTMDFVGAGVTATDAGGKTVVTVPGGAPAMPDAWMAIEGPTAPNVLAQVAGVAGNTIDFNFVDDVGGTAITWAIGAPKDIVVAPGFYSLFCTVYYNFVNAGDAATATVQTYFECVDTAFNQPVWMTDRPVQANKAVGDPTAPANHYAQCLAIPVFRVEALAAPPAHFRFGLRANGLTGNINVTFIAAAIARIGLNP